MNKSHKLFKSIFNFTLLIIISAVLFSSARAAGEVDPTFNPALVQVRNTSSIDLTRVNRIAVQLDGKVLIAGYFQTAGKLARSGIVRLNTDGTIDTTFNPPIVVSGSLSSPRFGGNIYALALQTNGKILIGGDFRAIGGIGGLALPGIARLNTDGSLDNSFNLINNGPQTFSGTVLDLKISGDGRITFVGNFTFSTSTVTFKNIARVNSSGVRDISFFEPPVISSSAVIYTLELLPDGKTLIGGAVSNSGFVYRLNADGSIDGTFSNITTSNSNSGDPYVHALRLLPDGKFLVGGGFALINGFTVKSLARFNADGSIDTSFDVTGSGANGTINDIEIAPNGMILVAGNFTIYNGVNRAGVARLNANGTLDNSFVPGVTPQPVQDLAILPDGKILIGAPVEQGTFSPALVKLNADGSIDSTFNLLLGNNGISNKVLVQPDGKILIGGLFSHIDNQLRPNLSRVNSDGTLDTTFNAFNLGNGVYGLDIRADGKILVSTSFGVVRLSPSGSIEFNLLAGGTYDAKFLNGGGAVFASSNRLRKITEAGTLDNSINVLANADIRKILIQPDGKYIIVGDFTQIAGVSRGRIARINTDGTLDTTFNPPGGASNTIFDVALQPDGRIIVGGSFPGINFNDNYKFIARLNSDGTLDTTFNTVLNGGVQSLKIQPDGKILIGGAFYLVNNAQRSGIARLNLDGSLDSSFNPGTGTDSSVLSIDLQANGNVIIGGSFTHVNNIDRLGVSRLINNLAPVRTRFDFDGDGKADLAVFRPSNGVWYLLNSQSGFGGAQFGSISDRIVPADYDGDGRTDLAVYRDGNWFIQRSTLGFTNVPFGESSDIPVPADYDGDGKADLAVYRPSTGTWYIQRSQLGFTGTQFGSNGDVPIAADFDGDGKADLAVFRPSNGVWYILGSTQGFYGLQFGAEGDKLVPADYDGDGKTDIAVFRPSTATWYINRSQLGFTSVQFGISTDIPVPADYDGDGRADLAVYRNDTWYIQRSTAGFTGVQFGGTGDKPIPSAFVR